MAAINDPTHLNIMTAAAGSTLDGIVGMGGLMAENVNTEQHQLQILNSNVQQLG